MSERVCWTTTAEGVVLALHHGDLTAEEVDVIVNAANEHLAHGGGVAGAISRRGGASIQAESTAWVREHGPVETGQVAITGAGSLPCRVVIHAVGPVWHGGVRREPELLESAVTNALELAEERRFTSIAMPAVSSGIFGFPKERCASILVGAGVAFSARHPAGGLREIRYTNFDAPTVAVFRAEFERRFGAALRTD
ncbi:MAG: macro domain-containing protein [Armatimonadetes bacterium]|nr:macro domain-containing protein [Armatimonadota bacterium]